MPAIEPEDASRLEIVYTAALYAGVCLALATLVAALYYSTLASE